jgi:hypothetical protein
MKSVKFKLVAALACLAALPAAHAASSSITVSVNQLTLTNVTTNQVVNLGWTGFGATDLLNVITPGGLLASPFSSSTGTDSTLTVVSAPGSGDKSQAFGFYETSFSASAGDEFTLTLPYTYAVSADSALDIMAFANLVANAEGGDDADVGDLVFVGAPAVTSSGVLNYSFKATSNLVNLSLTATVGAVSAVPEADALALALSGGLLAGGVALRRRKAAAQA